MIDHLVTFGEGLGIVRGADLWQAAGAAISTGGAEANVAMAASRSGARVVWWGRVGDDALGRRVVRELRAEGVAVLAPVDPVAPTGLLVKELRPGARTAVSYYRRDSAGSAISRADADALPLASTSLLHVTGVTPALSAGARDATLAAMERAATVGATISFDVNHRSRLWSTAEASPVYRALAERADILFASVDEVSVLLPGWSGTGVDEAADALASSGRRHVVVTAGAAGAVARVDGRRYRVPAVPVDVIDTVGAGDAFVGGYLAGLLHGEGPEDRLRRGAILGAAACRHPGDWEGAADISGLDDGRTDPVLR